jgi:hypothetical protein
MSKESAIRLSKTLSNAHDVRLTAGGANNAAVGINHGNNPETVGNTAGIKIGTRVSCVDEEEEEEKWEGKGEDFVDLLPVFICLFPRVLVAICFNETKHSKGMTKNENITTRDKKKVDHFILWCFFLSLSQFPTVGSCRTLQESGSQSISLSAVERSCGQIRLNQMNENEIASAFTNLGAELVIGLQLVFFCSVFTIIDVIEQKIPPKI